MKKLLVLILALALLVASSAMAEVKPYAEPVTITSYRFDEPNADSLKMDQWILENYGVKMEYTIIGWEDRNLKLLTDVAGGTSKDIQIMTYEEFPNNINKGLMQPLDSYLDLSAEVFSPVVLADYTWAGKHYAVNSGVSGVQPVGILYNVTMFENNGLTTPTEYYQDGEWNFDTFRELAIELTQDTDSDGANDQHGYESWMGDLFIIANGGNLVEYTADGGINLAWNTPAALSGMQMLSDAYNVEKYATVDNNNLWYDMMKNGRIAMGGERYVYIKNLVDDGAKYEYAWVPFPLGPDNTDGKGPGLVSGYGIPVGAKNPEAAAVYLYAMCEYSILHYEEDWSEYFDAEQLAINESARINCRSARFGGIGELNGMQWDLWGAFKWGGEDAVSVVERSTPAWQAQIDIALQKFELPTIEAFEPIAPIDFEDGTTGWLKTNAGAFEIIEGEDAISGKSLKITQENSAWGVLLYADYDKAPTPDYHTYTLSFDYKILEDMSGDYGLIVRARPYSTIFEDVNNIGWITLNNALAGDSGTMTATLGFQGVSEPTFFIYAGDNFDFVIDNVTLVEAN